jgi:hypothetical protein
LRFWLKIFPWLVIIGLLFLFQTDHPIDSDEGMVLTGAWNMLNGRLPYLDFFSYAAPGSLYLVMWTWQVFGDAYAVANALGCASLWRGAIGVQRWAWLVSGPRFPAGAPVLYVLPVGLWPLVNHGSFALTPAIWCAVFLCRAIQRDSRLDAALAGLAAGLTFLFLQHRGLALLGGVGFLLLVGDLRAGRRPWRGDTLAFAGAGLLPVLLLGVALPWEPLLRDLVVFPIQNYLSFHALDTTRIPTWPLFGTLIALAALAIALRKGSDRAVWSLLAMQGFLLVPALPRADLYHLSTVLFPFYALLPRALRGLAGSAWPLRAPLAVGLIFPIGFTAVSYVANARQLLTTLQADQSQALAYLRDECGEAPLLYAGPFIPGFYYESRRLNPSRYDYLFTDFFSEEQFEEVASTLRRVRPTCAVVAYPLVAKYGYRLDNPVDRLLAQRYRTVLREGPLEVLRLRSR